jgi:hypothetical protein
MRFPGMVSSFVQFSQQLVRPSLLVFMELLNSVSSCGISITDFAFKISSSKSLPRPSFAIAGVKIVKISAMAQSVAINFFI